MEDIRDSGLQSAILALAGDAFLTLDERRVIRSFNPAAERLFGRESADAVGRPVDALLPAFASERSRDAPRLLRARRVDGAMISVEARERSVTLPGETVFVLCLRPVAGADPGGDAWYRSAARVGGFGYWDRDLVTDAVVLSAETAEILGLSAEEARLNADALVEFVHPEDRPVFDRALAESIRECRRLDVTHRIVRPNGEARVVRSLGEFRFDAGGHPVALVGVVHDVTDVTRANEALRESQRTLRTVVDSTTAVIYIKDVDGRYVLINRRFAELFHVDDERARGKTDAELFPLEAAAEFRANDLRVQRERTAVEFEEVVPHDDGPHTYISIKFPLFRSSGEIYAVCGISTDITLRKRAEQQLAAARDSLEREVDERTADLRRTNARLQAEIVERENAVQQVQHLIATANEGIWMIDDSARTTFANARMAEILGTTVEAMTGASLFDFVHAEHRDEVQASLVKGLPETRDFEFRRADGASVWALVSANPLKDRDGSVIGALGMVTDITERKRAETQQALLARELDHRVKNTLAAVVALADLSMERADSFQAFREAFAGRVQAMARTHEVLARAQWGEVDVGEVVSIVLAPLESKQAARIVSSGDRGRIKARAMTPLALALNELGTNALKHGALSAPGGSVHVRWRAVQHAPFELTWLELGGPRVAVPSMHGSGLRLIRGLVEYELGGTLEVAFEREGLRCRLTLPADTFEAEPVSSDEPPTTESMPSPRTSQPTDALEGVRAIVVEDNFAVASSLGWLLESHGCTVVGTAANIGAAFELVDAVPFDVAVLDVGLGDTDVVEVARRIRDRGKRIVYLTAYAGPEVLPADLRAHPFLLKPVRSDELLAAILTATP
jgi:PAS domain S-box-containing protein